MNPNVVLKTTKYFGPPGEFHTPFAKQMAFLMLPHLEALYGGSAGGAKSDCLLMLALQYVDVPGYAGLIIRRNITDLKLPGNLLDRAHHWLDGRPEVKFDGSTNTFFFPTKRLNGLPGEPAKLTFGFLSKERSIDRYKGMEIQLLAFDELTQFAESEYVYLMSRLRKALCSTHGIHASPNCGDCIQASSIPIRVRSATNPGDVGHQWVKKRFDIRKCADGKFRGFNPDRPFIPSFLSDNPFIDQESYRKSLNEQNPIIKAQLLNGDWDIAANSRFRKEWVRHYELRGSYFILSHTDPETNKTQTRSFHLSEIIKVFGTIDPAVSRSDFVVKHDGKKRSNCVISCWAVTPSYDLLLVGHRVFRGELNVILQHTKSLYTEFKPEYMVIETNGPGEAVKQFLAQNGIRMKGISTTSDKVTNSIEAVTRMAEGRIWFPKSAPWLTSLEDELFTWTGDPDQMDDQVDSLSNAAKEVAWESFADTRNEVIASVGGSMVPFVY